jgi:hypothetical protein
VSRACVRFEATADGGWRPVTVLLATPKRLMGRTAPGDPGREAWLAEVLRTAKPPMLPDETAGTIEDLIGYYVGDARYEWQGALGNGHTTWCVEVRPELTVDALYQREVLRVIPKPLTRPDLKPTTEAPTTLRGYKTVK